VRAAYPDLDLHVDANGIYTADDLELLQELDRFGLTMIEQPFAPRDLLTHARLQRTIETPICLDESIETVDDLRTALQLEALQVLNAATDLRAMNKPEYRLHQLKQFKPVRYSIWISGQWRITFEYDKGDAYRVDFEQYH